MTPVTLERSRYSGTVANGDFRIVRGSVTDQPVEAIVNAANTMMRGGGGIDGRIHQLAGPRMLEELRRVAKKGAQVAEPVVTPGFDLPQKWVIHVAGPIWRGGDQGEDDLLLAAYRNCVAIALERGFGSLAFCSLSTGAFRFPKESAASLVVPLLEKQAEEHEIEIVLALYGSEEYELFSGIGRSPDSI
jgi:O-acetyl-ADP-ribose deacetylase (regulator of RNase III)